MSTEGSVPTRLWSTLTLKSVDDEQRIIQGTASTPTTDRMGDIVEPGGAKFSLPLPLLWQHQPGEPIGKVIDAKVSKTGITITAQIAKGILPEIDRRWALIKAGLVRGLSIGFKALEFSHLEDKSGGLRFTSWEWLELSTVTIPANIDASIAIIKHYDREPAATGPALAVSTTRPAPRTSSAASGPGRMKTMNASDRITELKTQRKNPAIRMAELMAPVLEDGATLGEPEANEYDLLAAEVKGLDAQILRLEDLERAQATAARPVHVARSVEEGTETRLPSNYAARVKDNLPPGIEFARYILCKASALRGEGSTFEIAKARYPDSPRLHRFIKTAVAGGTTTDATWAGPLVYADNLASEFIEYLRPMTIIGKFGQGGVPPLRRVPFNVRMVGQTSGTTANWVGQAVQKPVTKADYAATSLTWAKIAAIAVISEELARFSNPGAEGLIRDDLAAAIVQVMDTDFVDPDKGAVANVSPASITNNIAPLTSSGTDANALRADIAALFAPFIAANIDPTNAVFITTNTMALAISLMTNAFGQAEFPNVTMRGGTLNGIPLIASQYAASGSPVANLLILVNASDIFLADDGGVSVDVSREASIEMSDNPVSDTGTVVSMYQTNQLAIKAERFVNWARRRAAAVSYMDAVAYVAGSPA